MGGFIGIALGWVISRLISGIQLGNAAITPVVGLDTILLATLFSMAVGLFFGIYPATRAAKLNGAFHTADTKWPEDFHPEAAGAVLKEDDD